MQFFKRYTMFLSDSLGVFHMLSLSLSLEPQKTMCMSVIGYKVLNNVFQRHKLILICCGWRQCFEGRIYDFYKLWLCKKFLRFFPRIIASTRQVSAGYIQFELCCPLVQYSVWLVKFTLPRCEGSWQIWILVARRAIWPSS